MTPEVISKSCKVELIVAWVYEPGQKVLECIHLIILQQLMEQLRECYFGPSLELQSHEHVNILLPYPPKFA
jgi:hypothetical protein